VSDDPELLTPIGAATVAREGSDPIVVAHFFATAPCSHGSRQWTRVGADTDGQRSAAAGPAATIRSLGRLDLGWRSARDAVRTSWLGQLDTDTIAPMIENPPHTAGVNAQSVASPFAARGVTLTTAGYDALVRELELLRATHRAELAQRLRDARAFVQSGGRR
jgi:hypothetical protein